MDLCHTLTQRDTVVTVVPQSADSSPNPYDPALSVAPLEREIC